MKPIIILLLVFLAVLQYHLWFANDGVFAVIRLKHRIAEQESNNTQLQKQNAILLAEIMSLKNGSSAIENRARTDLGMVKKDETFYQVVR